MTAYTVGYDVPGPGPPGRLSEPVEADSPEEAVEKITQQGKGPVAQIEDDDYFTVFELGPETSVMGINLNEEGDQ